MALLQKAYLGSTPLFRDVAWYEGVSGTVVDAPSGSFTNNVVLTADTAAHTKGAWAEVIASTAADSAFIFVNVVDVATSGANTATLLDIATGASGSETAIASNIAVGGAQAGAVGGATRESYPGIIFGFPFKIPSGTRISARIQSVVTGGKTAAVSIGAIGGNYANAPTSVDVIGTNTANSEGTSFSGASGTWVQATASTSRAYRAVAVVVSVHSNTIGNFTGSFDVAVGASGSEVPFGTTRYIFGTAETSSNVRPYTYLFGRDIPAGSRLAVRHDIAANPDRYGFTLIGIP